MRFSIESLLYYAPKVTATGGELAVTVEATQRRLLGLGDFYGSSWPDEPFRNSYPRCQYAMLIIARQLADEIQGIGGGIEQMARTYGVAEEQNKADISRIQTGQDVVNVLTALGGGFPAPPDTPLPMPTPPPASSGEVPHPQANPAPAPSAALSSYVSPTPTPSPQPGVDPTMWHQSGQLRITGPWPTGDPARMEEAADCWRALNQALDAAWSDLRRYTEYILIDAEGPAADAFRDYVDDLIAPNRGSLARAMETTQYLHDACLHQAAEVRDVRRGIEQATIEFIATLVISQAIAVLTFGTAEEVAVAVEAGLIARLSSMADRLASVGEAIANTLESSAEALGKAGAAAFVGGTQSAIIAEADLEATNVISKAFGQKPAQGADALKVALEGGLVGAFFGQGSAGGLLGLSAAVASKKLIDAGETLKNSDGPSGGVGPALTALGRQLKDGNITVSAANAAATQLITQHQLTPVTFFTGAIANRFTTAISPHTGKHAAD